MSINNPLSGVAQGVALGLCAVALSGRIISVTHIVCITYYLLLENT